MSQLTAWPALSGDAASPSTRHVQQSLPEPRFVFTESADRERSCSVRPESYLRVEVESPRPNQFTLGRTLVGLSCTFSISRGELDVAPTPGAAVKRRTLNHRNISRHLHGSPGHAETQMPPAEGLSCKIGSNSWSPTRWSLDMWQGLLVLLMLLTLPMLRGREQAHGTKQSSRLWQGEQGDRKGCLGAQNDPSSLRMPRAAHAYATLSRRWT